MFGEVVSFIVLPWGPIDLELALADAAADPVKAHVNGFTALLFHRIVDDAFSGDIVRFDRSCWLIVAQFFEGHADWTRFTAVVEERGQLGLGCAGDNFF